jgi:hypothetical protein
MVWVPDTVTSRVVVVKVQVPAAQTAPAGHTRPQAPQWLVSACRSRQAADEPLPQRVCPVGQVQVPDAHEVPPVQAVPQLPQLLSSAAV